MGQQIEGVLQLMIGSWFILIGVGFLDFPGRTTEQAEAIQKKYKWFLLIGGLCSVALGIRHLAGG